MRGRAQTFAGVSAILFLLFGAGGGREGFAEDGPAAWDDPRPVILVRRDDVRPALRTAIHGAARRLAQPGCQRVFSDFSARDGRSLQRRLDALGQTGPGYLGLIVFADGQSLPVCQRPSIMAVTAPGSRVVHVCPRFSREHFRDSRLAEAALIHEALHSLGLGENPPSSFEITERILARCKE